MRGVPVAEIVRADAGQCEPHEPRVVIAIPQIARVDRASGRSAKQEAGIAEPWPEPKPLLFLPHDGRADGFDRFVGQQDRASTTARFVRTENRILAGAPKRLIQMHLPRLKVDVCFGEAEKFAEARACSRNWSTPIATPRRFHVIRKASPRRVIVGLRSAGSLPFSASPASSSSKRACSVASACGPSASATCCSVCPIFRIDRRCEYSRTRPM